MAFAPKGDVPLWRKVYDHAQTCSVGDLIGWVTLTELLGYDPEPPGANRSPIRTAAARLADAGVVTLVSVRGEGYRVVAVEDAPGEVGLTSVQRALLAALERSWVADTRRLDVIESALRRAGIEVPAP